MDTLKKLTNQFQKFYTLVESHENQIQDWFKESKKPLQSIINQSLILRAAAPEDSILNTGLEKFKGYREALVEIILSSLEEELYYLEEIRDKISAANEKLKNEQKAVEHCYIQYRQKGLSASGAINPCCPLIEQIVDWCYDIWSYYHSLYLQISNTLILLNFEDEESVTNLQKAFQEDSELKMHVDTIRSYSFSKFEFLVS